MKTLSTTEFTAAAIAGFKGFIADAMPHLKTLFVHVGTHCATAAVNWSVHGRRRDIIYIDLYLPPLDPAKRLTRKQAQELAAYWVHEALHVILTEQGVMDTLAKEAAALPAIFNGIEDVRIEQNAARSGLVKNAADIFGYICLLYTSPSPRDATLSRMPSSA